MPPKRVVDTAKTGEARGKGAAELAAERVALQEEKGEESSDDEFLMPGERRLKNRLKLEVPRQLKLKMKYVPSLRRRSGH